MNLNKINRKVEELLALFPHVAAPIRVDEIAKRRGLRVIPYALEENISGMLIIKEGKGTIAYQQSESAVRRRFTIAHELGHYELHSDRSSLFLDKQFNVLFRSQVTEETLEKQRLEQEANAFAAALLMPETLLKKEIALKQFDFGNENSIKELAKKFNVSSIAMYYRITNLQLL